MYVGLDSRVLVPKTLPRIRREGYSVIGAIGYDHEFQPLTLEIFYLGNQ